MLHLHIHCVQLICVVLLVLQSSWTCVNKHLQARLEHTSHATVMCPPRILGDTLPPWIKIPLQVLKDNLLKLSDYHNGTSISHFHTWHFHALSTSTLMLDRFSFSIMSPWRMNHPAVNVLLIRLNSHITPPGSNTGEIWIRDAFGA